VQLGRILMSSHLGYVALAQAAVSKNQERAGHLRRAARHQRKLEAENTAWSSAYALYIQGQCQRQAALDEQAKRTLQSAVDAFTDCHMHALAAATLYRLGTWTDGEPGAAMIAQARTALSAQGATKPDRLLQSLAPGS